MQLEKISFGTPNDTAPLLLIHGSYCGAWIWEPSFLPYFAKKGFWGIALSLRGHGKSEGVEDINSFGLADYLDDINEGVRFLGEQPVLIGHSLGGYLAQKYAIDHEIAGMILLSSPSLLGLTGSAQHITMRHPQLAMQLSFLMSKGMAALDPQIISAAFFTDPTAAREMEYLLPLLQKESSRISMEACWPEFRWPCKRPPTLVIGGDADSFVPVSDFVYESSFWQGELKIIPNAAHGLMLDACREEVAEYIVQWMIHSVK